MPCGSPTLKSIDGQFWALSVTSADGGLVTTGPSPVGPLFHNAPILSGPTTFWSLSVDVDGSVVTTRTGTSLGAAATLSVISDSGAFYNLTVDDTGTLATTPSGLTGLNPGTVPYPVNVNMSTFGVVNLACDIPGAENLTIGADYSIWSCSLNKFVNEDTTNIVVVLDE